PDSAPTVPPLVDQQGRRQERDELRLQETPPSQVVAAKRRRTHEASDQEARTHNHPSGLFFAGHPRGTGADAVDPNRAYNEKESQLKKIIQRQQEQES